MKREEEETAERARPKRVRRPLTETIRPADRRKKKAYT